MKILVLGATGYLGTHICEYLKNNGHDVSAYIRNPKKAGYLDELNVEYKVGDIMDQPKLEEAMQDGYDAVVNSVGYLSDRSSWKKSRLINAESCNIIAHAMQSSGIKRLIHISSLAAYGKEMMNGTEEVKPVKHRSNKYGVTKLEGEENLAKYTELDITVLRPGHVIGRRDRVGIVPILYHTARKYSRWIENGKAIIPLIYVDDVCKAIEICLDQPDKSIGELFNVVNEEEITIEEVVNQMTHKLNVGTPKNNMSRRRAYTIAWFNEAIARIFPIKISMTRAGVNAVSLSASFSNKKLSALGWSPSKSPSEMVDEWIDWRSNYENQSTK